MYIQETENIMGTPVMLSYDNSIPEAKEMAFATAVLDAVHKHKMSNGSCCGGRGVLTLSTANCPTDAIPLNSTEPISVAVSKGVAPFTYVWSIIRPDGVTDTLPNGPGPYNYNYNQKGIYQVNILVKDSCPTGSLQESASCYVSVSELPGAAVGNQWIIPAAILGFALIVAVSIKK